jgi:hypothetical protein
MITEKTQQFNDLQVTLAIYQTEKRNLELRVTALESDKYELEKELEIEREKGREAMHSLQQEAERFLIRFGDRKGQYIREQKSRESKKRSHAEASSSQQQQEMVTEPLSPASTSRRMVGVETVKKSKKRRLGVYGDSGIGIEHEEDEGFEGSVNMPTQYSQASS